VGREFALKLKELREVRAIEIQMLAWFTFSEVRLLDFLLPFFVWNVSRFEFE
jgi:hypothetical protein